MRIFLTNQGQNGVSRYQNIDSPNGLSYSSVNRADFCGCPFSTSILADNISHPQSLELHHNTLLLKNLDVLSLNVKTVAIYVTEGKRI